MDKQTVVIDSELLHNHPSELVLNFVQFFPNHGRIFHGSLKNITEQKAKKGQDNFKENKEWELALPNSIKI